MSKQATVRLYSAQKNADTGNGYLCKAVPGAKDMTDDQVKEAVEAMRTEQKRLNAEFKAACQAGNRPPPGNWPGRKPAPGTANDGAAPRPVTTEVDNVAIPAEVVIDARGAAPAVPQAALGARTPFELKLDAGTGNTTYMIGSSKQGKSTALMAIYDRYYADKQFVSILWTDSAQAPVYRKHKKLIIANGWNKEGESIVLEQHRIQVKTKNEYKFLNMFDDLPHLRECKVVDKLVLTYRNSKMSTIVSMQYSKGLKVAGRANVNNVLIFGQNTDEAIEGVIGVYLRGYLRALGIRDLVDQINWFKAMTADHSFIYVRPAFGDVSFHRMRAGA